MVRTNGFFTFINFHLLDNLFMLQELYVVYNLYLINAPNIINIINIWHFSPLLRHCLMYWNIMQISTNIKDDIFQEKMH